MRYMMLLYSQETAEGPSPDQLEYLTGAHKQIMADGRRQGVLVAVDRLQRSSSAKTVRSAGALVVDGPFIETKEQLAGYYIFECRDVNEAIEWARRIPTSPQGTTGSVEIRPIARIDGRRAASPRATFTDCMSIG